MSSSEVGFSTFVVCLGGFMFAYMVGNISKLLDKVDTKATQYRSRIYEAESFMHREKMPIILRGNIRKYLAQTFLNQRSVPSYLSGLSGSLKREMYLTLFKDLLVKVPFFVDWSDAAITEIIEHFRLKMLPAEEILYHEGDVGDRMYFLHQGSIEMAMSKKSANEHRSKHTSAPIADRVGEDLPCNPSPAHLSRPHRSHLRGYVGW